MTISGLQLLFLRSGDINFSRATRGGKWVAALGLFEPHTRWSNSEAVAEILLKGDYGKTWPLLSHVFLITFVKYFQFCSTPFINRSLSRRCGFAQLDSHEIPLLCTALSCTGKPTFGLCSNNEIIVPCILWDTVSWVSRFLPIPCAWVWGDFRRAHSLCVFHLAMRPFWKSSPRHD